MKGLMTQFTFHSIVIFALLYQAVALEPDQDVITSVQDVPTLETDRQGSNGVFRLPEVGAMRCGEHLNGVSNGIFHKPFEPVSDNERCVWTVRVDSALSYLITVLYLGFPVDEGQEHLVIAGFGKANTTEQIIPTETGNYTMKDVSLLVFTFQSGPQSFERNHTGFVLQYHSIPCTDCTVPTPWNGSPHHFIIPATFSFIKHPATGEAYQANELSTFLFMPDENTFSPDDRMNIVYYRGTLQGAACNDNLSLYFFEAPTDTSIGGWQLKQIICGDIETELIKGNDLILVVFESDASVHGTGFNFTYSAC